MLQGKNERGAGLRARLVLPGAVLAGILALTVGLGLNHGAAADQESQSLAGTWNVTVALTNCGTGAPLPIPQNPFPVLNTFLSEGAVLETGSRTPFRSPGHGTWERIAHRVFESRFTFFRYDAAGTYLGTQETTRTIHLVSPTEFTAEAEVVFRDANGNPAGGGCARETATRY